MPNKDYIFKVRVQTVKDQAKLELSVNNRTVAKWSGPLRDVKPRMGSTTLAPQFHTRACNVVIESPQIRMLKGKLEKSNADD